MNSITSNVSQSLLKGSFSGGLSSAASQSVLLQAANSQKIPDVNVFTGGEEQSLAGSISQSLSEQGNVQDLQALAKLNSYSASNSLLGAVYGTEGGTSSLLAASVGAESGGANALLNSTYLNNTDAVDQYV